MQRQLTSVPWKFPRPCRILKAWERSARDLPQQLSGTSWIDLLTIQKKAVTQIRDKSLQLALDTRINWLKNNFKTIFNKAYPSSRSSKLTHPKVTFLKEEKGKQFFSMTCVEKSQGSSFRLQVNYQYNLATGKWSIYYDRSGIYDSSGSCVSAFPCRQQGSGGTAAGTA